MEASRDASERAFGAASAPAGLQNSFCQLFDKERHAVGARDDLFHRIDRESLVACDPLHEHRALAPVQPAESEHRHVRSSAPWRLKLRPEGNQKQHW